MINISKFTIPKREKNCVEKVLKLLEIYKNDNYYHLWMMEVRQESSRSDRIR